MPRTRSVADRIVAYVESAPLSDVKTVLDVANGVYKRRVALTVDPNPNPEKVRKTGKPRTPRAAFVQGEPAGDIE